MSTAYAMLSSIRESARPNHREAVMKLRKLAKDPNSNQGACPAVYVAEDDPAVMVVQGKILDQATTAELDDVAGDETAVRVPTETLIRAVERYQREQLEGT
jgi:hypothetical protein